MEETWGMPKERKPVELTRCAIALILIAAIVLGSIAYFNQSETPAEQKTEQSVPSTNQVIFRISNVAEIAARRAQAERETMWLCGPGYPGPGGKADCEAAKKLLSDPRYFKIVYD